MADQEGFELVCTARETDLSADRQVTILPAGEIHSKAGTFIMDHVAADETIGEFRKHGADLPIDIDHKTVYAQDGEAAPAVGWVKRMVYRDHVGLIGSVEWTDEGREAIQSGKFRYLSPVVAIRKSDRRVVALHSCAITTKPAIAGMERLAASERLTDFLLALQAEGTRPSDDEATAKQTLEWVYKALGVAPDSNAEQIYDAIVRLRQEAAAEDTEQTPNSLAAMREQVRAEVKAELEIEETIGHYVKANKLNRRDSDQMDWAHSVAGRDLEMFRRLMKAAPQTGPPQGRITPRPGDDTVDVQETNVARQARVEFQAHHAGLSKWTTEEAFVAMRLRDHNLKTHARTA